jgi:hypothetical protein
MNDTNPPVEKPEEKSSVGYGTALACPACGSIKSKVIGKENVRELVKRRRVCDKGHRFSTMEVYSKPDPYSHSLGVMKAPLRDDEIEKVMPRVRDAFLSNINYKNFIKTIYTL